MNTFDQEAKLRLQTTLKKPFNHKNPDQEHETAFPAFNPNVLTTQEKESVQDLIDKAERMESYLKDNHSILRNTLKA